MKRSIGRHAWAVAGALVFGLVVTSALHLWFTTHWSYFVRSVPAYPQAFRFGHAPDPHLVSAPNSRWLGGAALLVAGVLVGVLIRRWDWPIVLAFLAAVAVGEVLLLFTLFDFPGNLWPFTVVGTLVVAAVPAALGVAVGITLARAVAPFGGPP